MKLSKTYAGAAGDPGEWVLFHADPTDTRSIKEYRDKGIAVSPGTHPASVFFRVRPVPPELAAKIARRVRDEKRRTLAFVPKTGRAEMDVDPVLSFEESVERAVEALVDVHNGEIEVGDNESAAEWSKALGTIVNPGELSLDGKLTPDVKRLLLRSNEVVVNFVNRESDKLKATADADQQESSGN